MRFIDEATISVQSGDGGRGCVSFRRERFVPRGGPDGGDGGDGGDVIITASSQKRTLYNFRNKKFFKAQRGGYGLGSQKTGKNGQPLTIEVPPGAIVTDADTGEVLFDFDKPGDAFVVARGGRGGRGNRRFATSTNRAPRHAQPGEPGQTLSLKLELKLLADIGIIGLPNAGKSTLISILSSARPKIADYPFTTLTPNLGMVENDWGEPYAVADIPGLIEGAHEGAGLGMRFLRHIERTRLLVHLIDTYAVDPENPLKQYQTINRELSLYSRTLAEKPQLIVLNKLDLSEAETLADRFETALAGQPVLRVSAATGQGVEPLKNQLAKILQELDEDASNVIS